MSSSAAFPSPGSVIITKEMFNAFHKMDRALYARLVVILAREKMESMQVMALWLWLERYHEKGRDFIYRLLSFPDSSLNVLAQESAICIRLVEENSVPISDFRDLNDLPVLQNAMGGGQVVNLFYIRENRARILEGVSKIMQDVCFRAFGDIGVQVQRQPPPPPPPPMMGPYFAPPRGADLEAFGGNMMQVGEMVGEDAEEMEEEVEPDRRTIFLTFSKGYPTSEYEVKEFFTRRYGDIIERIQMQEVLPGEQSLYARLVVRSNRIIDVVLEGQSRAKFTINGKHVWARKYVRKNN